jgi:hypothetical protein
MHKELAAKAGHVDHDMALFLDLHEVHSCDGFQRYPETVRRGLDVACATLFRSLLPFFHGARPDRGPDKRDLAASQFLNDDLRSFSDPFNGWTPEEKERLADADRLAAHLSAGRSRQVSDWGGKADLEMVLPKIIHFIKEVDEAGIHFGRTVQSLQKYNA